MQLDRDQASIFEYAYRLKGTERIIVQQGLLSTTFGYEEAYIESKKKLNDPENEEKVACIFKIHWSDFSYHFILD